MCSREVNTMWDSILCHVFFCHRCHSNGYKDKTGNCYYWSITAQNEVYFYSQWRVVAEPQVLSMLEVILAALPAETLQMLDVGLSHTHGWYRGQPGSESTSLYWTLVTLHHKIMRKRQRAFHTDTFRNDIWASIRQSVVGIREKRLFILQLPARWKWC